MFFPDKAFDPGYRWPGSAEHVRQYRKRGRKCDRQQEYRCEKKVADCFEKNDDIHDFI